MKTYEVPTLGAPPVPVSTYRDTVHCPQGHRFTVQRRAASAGHKVSTYCRTCEKAYSITAGPHSGTTADAPRNGTKWHKSARKLLERDIEAQLVKCVKELGGEVRKVAWLGRVGAPDRVVMLPPTAEQCGPGPDFELIRRPRLARTIWVELKAPGKAATFPRNAHERAQQREHERMRRVGQRVAVVDSFEQIEELLK